jgi:transposase InsO family protein
VSARTKQDRTLLTEIERLFYLHRERYGSPRLYRAMRTAGWPVSRRRIARLMRTAGLRAKAVRGYRAKAKTHQVYARHPNRLWGRTIDRTNQVWAGDITYLRVDRTWRYLAVVLDLHSRRVLAWTLTRGRTAAVTSAALRQAARRRPARGVIFHSDRGSEYMSAAFGACVARLGMLQSASARGPGDNSHIESFFHSLKAELTRGVAFTTDLALRRALVSYIRYYNATRLHSGLNYCSPLAFERAAA